MLMLNKRRLHTDSGHSSLPKQNRLGKDRSRRLKTKTINKMKAITFILLSMALTSDFVADSKSVSVGTKDFLRIKEKYMNLFKPLVPTAEEGSGGIDIDIDTSEIARMIPKDGFFNYFIPAQKQAMNKLVHILEEQPSLERALEVAEHIRREGKINLNAWYYAVTSWSLSDPRMRAIPKPSPVDVMPDNFINSKAMARAEEIRHLRRNGVKADECVVIDGEAGADNGRENDIWYWREDLMNNAFHMYYHLYYGNTGGQPRQDRRAETFYYLHRDVGARYDAERLSNGLPRTESLVWGPGSIIEEGYDPHLNDTLTGQEWIPRAPSTPLSDIVIMPQLNVTLDQVKVTERRVYEAINSGNLLQSDGSLYPIDNVEGTDILGDVIEGNQFGINPGYYSFGMAIHGSLHIGIAISGRPPGGDFSSPSGVMSIPSTSFRDVIFYRWHLYINDIFDANKQRLRPYTPTGGELPLAWNGVTVTNMEVQTSSAGSFPNLLFTFFGERRFELRKGLDHQADFEEPVDVCAKHLDHEDFVYKIVVSSENFYTRPATVRLFLAPRADENGVRFNMREQRDLFFTLDVFQATLQPGENVIYRASNASSVTVPWHQIWSELEEGDPSTPLCGCGLPQHLNIPKGRPEGMAFDLVAMITNFVDDAVEYDEPECRAAYLYCGLPGTKYPDAKPMAYPFDRLPYHVDANGNPTENGTPVRDLDEYVRHIPNMGTTQVLIAHMGDRTDRR